MSQVINLFHVPSEFLFYKIKESGLKYSYDYKRHIIELINPKNECIAYTRLPLTLDIDSELNLKKNETKNVLYISIESDNGAICVMNGDKNTYHTTFSAYMTRKKQGYSQIKYLNKKGKSRAGSRVRLASTFQFFEDINETLAHLFDEQEFDRIGMNCNPTLIPYLFGAKNETPFEKNDSRLYKIPLHIPQSNFTNLNKAINILKAPILFIHKEEQAIIDLIQEIIIEE